MSDNQKRQLVPRLRFPEFRDAKEWNVEPLDKVARLVKKKISLDELKIEDYVSTENMLTDYGGIEKAKKLPPSGSATHYKADDILIANIRPYLKKVWRANKSGGASNDVIVIRPKQVIRNDYFTLIIANDDFINYLMKTAKGVKMPRGDIASVKAYDVYYPEPSEQKKIADCLGSLDELIAAEGRKLAALRDHKKGLMQQLFPREGETRPRLRFPEFMDKGEWEEKPLVELAKFTSGGTPSKIDPKLWNGDIPWISASAMHDTVVYDSELKVTQEAIGNGTRLATKGSILILVRGSMLFKRVPICIAERDVAFNQDVKSILPKRGVVTRYLLYYLIASESRIAINATGIGAGKIDTEHLKSLIIGVPSSAEQQKIADCLSALDALITAQAEKLDALRTHKRGLMQQLFPAPEDV